MIIPKLLPNGAIVMMLKYNADTGAGNVLARVEKTFHAEYVVWSFYDSDLSTTHSGHYFGSPHFEQASYKLEAYEYFDGLIV